MEDKIGAINEGMTADLVLLQQNPLTNITNTKLQVGTMVNGKWYTQSEMKTSIRKLWTEKK